jgi:hypothetical protein
MLSAASSDSPVPFIHKNGIENTQSRVDIYLVVPSERRKWIDAGGRCKRSGSSIEANQITIAAELNTFTYPDQLERTNSCKDAARLHE